MPTCDVNHFENSTYLRDTPVRDWLSTVLVLVCGASFLATIPLYLLNPQTPWEVAGLGGLLTWGALDGALGRKPRPLALRALVALFLVWRLLALFWGRHPGD